MAKKRKLQKRILSLVMAVVLSVGQNQIVATAQGFSDVPVGIWYEPFVNDLVDRGIMSGVGNNRFMPGKALSRGELVTVLGKIAMTGGDIDQYRGFSFFRDVPKSEWYAPFINWANEAGIVEGYGGSTFRPNQAVTRQEFAVILAKYAQRLGYQLSQNTAEKSFGDQSRIASWAVSAVKTCQRAGVFNGDGNNRFNPQKATPRSEASAAIYNYLSAADNGAYQIIRKRYAGVYVTGVTFDATNYNAGIAMANDRVNGGESMGSMISRTGAKFAVNAAFFDMGSYVPSATIVDDGEIITTQETYAPHKPSFVVSRSGVPTIENFKLNQTVSLVREGEEIQRLEYVSTNRRPSNATDPTRILFTPRWGQTVGTYARDAFIFDGEGTILYSGATWNDITIPRDGGVLYQRSRREYEGEFFDSGMPGDRLYRENRYDGASTWDIDVSISAGPRIVKEYGVYGDANTYRQEGLGASDIVSGSAKRVAIGVKGNRVVIITVNNCTMAKLSEIMQQTGCSDAMNLDGGGSTGLYCQGTYLATPSRNLNNMIYFN